MPELPEVETVRRGLAQSITGRRIESVDVRQPRLRYVIPASFASQVVDQTVHHITRRAKYLLVQLDDGTLIWHLGMSGSIWVQQSDYQPIKHDHLLFFFDKNLTVRYHDPRRFGLIDYCPNHTALSDHRLLHHLGPEPLSDDFSTQYLYDAIATRSVPIKTLLMNNSIVVGVGNIYACESLFQAGINPTRRSNTLTKKECSALIRSIVTTLSQAIAAGGSTLRDFVNSEGQPGYFQQQLFVYGRQNTNCRVCNTPLIHLRISNRSTVYCPQCQS